MTKNTKKYPKRIPLLIVLLIIITGALFGFLKLKPSIAYKENINYYTGNIYSLNYGANLIDNMSGNNIISPLNINASLISLYNGSDNNTKKELKNYFHLKEQDANQVLIDKINSNITNNEEVDKYTKNYEKLIEKLYKEGYDKLTLDKINKLEDNDKEKILLLLKKINLNYEGMYKENRMSLKNINKYTLTKKDINYNNYYIKNTLEDVLNKWESYELKTKITNDNTIYYNKKIYTLNNDYLNTIKDLNINVKDIKEYPYSNDKFISINTISITSEWETNFNKDIVKNVEFYNKNNELTAVEMMYEYEQYYYENNYAIAFKKNYQNTKYSFIGILPKSDDYKASNLDLNNLITNPKKGLVLVGIPRFTLNENNDIGSIVSKKNINLDDVNLSKMSNDNIKIDRISEQINFTMGDKGTTDTKINKQIEVIEQLDKPKREIILNKPFYFAIINNETNDCIFIGRIENL